MSTSLKGKMMADFYMSDGEIVITVRNLDDEQLTYQDAYDAIRAVLAEAFEKVDYVQPITEQDIEENTELN